MTRPTGHAHPGQTNIIHGIPDRIRIGASDVLPKNEDAPQVGETLEVSNSV
jgi:hypothetical protein